MNDVIEAEADRRVVGRHLKKLGDSKRNGTGRLVPREEMLEDRMKRVSDSNEMDEAGWYNIRDDETGWMDSR